MCPRFLYTLLVAFLSIMPLGMLVAQNNVVLPSEFAPTATIIDKDGNSEELVSGGEYTGEAPLNVHFAANVDEVEGFSLVCTWVFMNNDDEEPFLTRYDADVDYLFREAGSFTITLNVTYTSNSNPEIVHEYELDPFLIAISESSLKVPNAFSPNGDGINDYFNVYDVKSIVSFNAAIYNRWGQQLYSWGIDEMTCEECGWDGTYKGNPVKDGVYYVVVTARGADGINYEIKGDVNLLRGYSENINP